MQQTMRHHVNASTGRARPRSIALRRTPDSGLGQIMTLIAFAASLLLIWSLLGNV
jgi:hypothetical protein